MKLKWSLFIFIDICLLIYAILQFQINKFVSIILIIFSIFLICLGGILLLQIITPVQIIFSDGIQIHKRFIPASRINHIFMIHGNDYIHYIISQHNAFFNDGRLLVDTNDNDFQKTMEKFSQIIQKPIE